MSCCRESPGAPGPIDLGEGVEPGDPSWPPPVTVFGFDEVVQVLRDNETYSSMVYADVMGMVMGRTILEMDEPEHRIHRALVAASFRSKMLERWEEGLVALVVNELIDAFIERGRSDLVRDVTFNFPVQVIARILGLPRSDYPTVPALGDRAHQRRGQLGAWRGRLGRLCATTSST